MEQEQVNDAVTRAPMASPCTGVCRLGSDGLCEGCHRTAGEIGGWMHMSECERRRLMDCVLPMRASRATE
jgi:hypothetical protein